MGRLWLATGVVAGELNEFNTFADSTGMQVKVPTGAAWVEGQLCISDTLTTLALAAANGANPRIDRVVLRKDNSAKTFSLLVLTGTPSASPSVPTLTQTATIWDVPLAQVLIPTSATTIAANNVTDERPMARNADVGAVQVLTNKTLITPTIASFVNAQHGHTNAASGGTMTVPRYAMLAPAVFLPSASAGVSGATLAQVSDSFEWQFADGAHRGIICRDALTVPSSYTGTPITFRMWGYSPTASQSFVVRLYVTYHAPPGGAAPYSVPILALTTVLVSHSTAGGNTPWTFNWSGGGVALPGPNYDLGLLFTRDATDGADTSADTMHLRKVMIDWGS